MSNTRFIVVRHCEAQGNIKRVFNGITDSDITDNGVVQLKYLSNRMKDMDFDLIYSSPLRRCVKTARACNSHHNLPIHIEKRLIEINGGEMENLPFADFPIKYPQESKMWNLAPDKFSISGGESMQNVYDRMKSVILNLCECHFGKSILIATHGCAIRNLLCWANGLDISNLNDVPWGENTSVSEFIVDSDFTPHICFQNDVSHIPSENFTLGKQDWWKDENRNKLVFK